MLRKSGHVRIIGLIALVIGFAATACARHDAPAKRQPARTVVVRDTQPTQGARADTVESGGEVSGEWTDSAVTARWITDANVISLFGAMNARQIAAADVELENWHNDAARAFAASMAREHAELQHSADSLAARLGITPVAPALTKPWMSAMQAQIDSLRRVRASSFDSAFVHQQITSHQLMLEYLQQLASASQHPDVQSMLSAAAKRVASQLDRARSLEGTLVAPPD